MNQTGFLEVPHGKIFYSLSAPPKLNSATSKPPILFIHAGIADHSLWDYQVQHLVARGWTTLRYDLFGFGKSHAHKSFLESDPREKIDYVEHAASLLRKVLLKENHEDTHVSHHSMDL